MVEIVEISNDEVFPAVEISEVEFYYGGEEEAKVPEEA